MIKKLLSFLILCLATLTLISPTYAVAVSGYFKDTETSTGNSFSADTLDISLKDTLDNPLAPFLFDISGILPGGSQTKTVRVQKDGNLDYKYEVSFTKTAGDDVLCDALQIEAKFESSTKYSGSLSSLSVTPVANTETADDWDFTVSLADSSGSLRNKSCSFNLVFKGWQTNSDGTWGFIDEESVGNTVSSGTWVASGDVVINELMWSGSSGNSDDEWIELRNTTGNDIDLSGWQLTKLVSSEELMTTIPNGRTIPANGFFLISNFDKAGSALNIDPDLVASSVVLKNTDLQIKLYKANWTNAANLIDTADDGSGTPLAGENGSDKQSMERNDDPSTGWHTCTDSACNDVTYWDSEGNNYGTPKATNLSSNDPSSSDYALPQVLTPDSLTTPEATPSASINTDPAPEASESASTAPLPTETPPPVGGPTPTPEPEATPAPTSQPEPTPAPPTTEPSIEPTATPQPEGEIPGP